MNHRGKPELQERLAAEFALGTLRGAARRRFQAWMREDASLSRAVAEWESRLFPLGLGIPESRPPARLWSAIADRVFPEKGRGRADLWNNVALWRSIGLAASGAAAALLVAVGVISPPAPQPAPAPVVVRVPANEVPAAYFALLSDPKTQKPVLLVSAARSSDQLYVKTLDAAIHVSGQSLELWALPKNRAPKSLGLVERTDRTTLKLAASADQALGDVPALAVSLEPSGGSPTGAPTGPVLFSGPCLRYW
jgi:anti-sigma-K factor RskA